jgi:hypothetical protein
VTERWSSRAYAEAEACCWRAKDAEAEAERLQAIALDELRDLGVSLARMRPATFAGVLAKAKAMKFSFPEDDAVAAKIEECLKVEGPFDSEAIALSIARNLLALAEEEDSR